VRKPYTIDEVCNILKEDGCTLLSSEYKNAHQIIKIECTQGHKTTTRFWDVLRHRGASHCHKCNQNKLHIGIDVVRQYLKEQDCILLSSEYKNNATKLHYMCSCGRENWKTWAKLKENGCGCKFCTASQGEQIIAKELKERSINFIREKTFDELIGKTNHPLRFDFYFPEQQMCIEYDGTQHFRAVKRFGGLPALKQRQINDQRKTEWCGEKKMKLVRFNYKQKRNLGKLIQELFHGKI